MRHRRIQARSIALALPLWLALAGVAGAQTPAPSATPNPVHECALNLTGGIRNYTNDYLQLIGDCEVSKLDGDACDTNLQNNINNLDSELHARIDQPGECSPAAQDALCPLESDILSELFAALTGNGATSLKTQLTEIIEDVFTSPYDGCTRPVGAVSSDALSCGEKIADVLAGQELVEKIEAAFFSCERPRLVTPGLEVCVDDLLGDPIKQDLIEEVADRLGDLDLLDARCDAAAIQELGCPLGADSLGALKDALDERLRAFVQQLNLRIFHSDCQGNLPGQPTEPVPANVTLLPSGTTKQLHCGETIDAAFLGSNTEVAFDSDLNCGPSQTAIDGVIVAKSGTKLNGRVGKVWSIRGPQRSSLRTGTGIKLLPGVTRVDIRNFKAIENFGVGIEDAPEGNNRKLAIHKTTVRRNVVAGLRIRSPRAVIDQIVADKNGIGMDLSGDGIKVKNGSQAKGSLYPPKVGIQLSGIDRNANGTVVQISSGTTAPNVIELNQGIGIHILEGAHLVVQAQVRDNLGDGIVIEPPGVGSRIDSNTVKLNQNGIVVRGDMNLIDSNTCEENLGDGYVIESVPVEGGGTIGGTGNTLLSNSSGKKTDRGNGGVGYRIGGSSTVVDTNEAEANLGSGFVVTGTTTLFKGNTAQSNGEHGFDIQSAGHTFDTCSAEDNDQAAGGFHEWVLVAGSSASGDNNSAGGDTIGIPAAGGFCDDGDDCPLDD